MFNQDISKRFYVFVLCLNIPVNNFSAMSGLCLKSTIVKHIIPVIPVVTDITANHRTAIILHRTSRTDPDLLT